MALDEVIAVAQQLHPERLVEPEVVADLLDVAGRRREVADQRLHRIARREMDDQEIDDQDERR